MTRLSYRYKILEELGAGAEARVYRVLDLLGDGTERALKLSSQAATPERISHLGREFAILSRLHHPHIARVHDFGVLHHDRLTQAEPRAYYTRDLVEGSPIAAAPSAKVLAAWAESLLRVLGFLHGQGVLHRDLKPDNILLARRGAEQLPVLIDFGLSGADRGAGTVAYAAPELLQAATASVATDLYSLGATLLELASGEPPVDATRPAAAVDQILGGSVQKRAAALHGVHRQLVTLLEALTDPDPRRRPASAREALTQLTGAAEEVLDQGVATVPPFLGRQPLLERLIPPTDPVSETQGTGRCVLLRGAAGVGKTRLLSELRLRLQLLRRPVVQLSCSPGAQRGTLGAFQDAARWLLPAGGAPPGQTASRHTLFETLWQALLRVAEPRGLWLLVDDAQEADDDGRAWLRFLSRAAPDSTLHTLIVTRPRGAPTLSEVEPVELNPLPPATSQQILTHLAGELPDRVQDAALALAQGNPALLTGVAHHLRRLGPSVAAVEDLTSLELPESLLDAEAQRLAAALGPPPWPLLQRLAVCTKPVSRTLLIDSSGDEAGLRRLLAAGVVRCRDGRCDPPDPVTRDAALRGLDAEQRTALHREWIERLGAQGADSVHLAHHRLHAGRDRQGLPEVLAAARELRARGATGRAAGYMAWCVATAREAGATPDILARHTLELAELLLESGRLEEAWEQLQSVDPARLEGRLAADCALTRADVQERQGHLDGAEQTLAPLVGRDTLTRAQEGTLALHRARLQVRRGRHEAALEIALAGAAKSEEDARRSALLNVAAVAETYLGRHHDAQDHLEAAIKLAHAARDARAEALAVSQLALSHHSQGQLAEAEGHHRRSLELAESAGLQADLPGLLLNLAAVLQERGRLGEALALYRRAAALARRLGRDATLANALANYGNLMMEMGGHAEARRTLEDARDRAQQVGLPLLQAMIRLYLAEVDWRQGRLEEALEGCVGAADTFGTLDLSLRRNQALLTAAEVALDADQPERAEGWLAEVAQAGGADTEQLAGRLHLLRGRQAARSPEGRAQAEAGLDAASRWATAHRDRSLAAAATFQRARLRLSVGELDGARNDAEAALATQRELEQDIPTELRERFWQDPRRAAVSALLEQLLVPDGATPQAPPATTPRTATRSLPAPPGAQGARPLDPNLLRILRFNRELLAERNTSRLLARVMDTAVELTGAERGFLLLRDAGGVLRVDVARNIDRETIRRGGMTFSRSVAQEVAETGEPILTVSAQDDARLQLFASVSELRLKSVLSVPIRTSERTLGTLYLDNRFVRGRFSEQDLELLQTFADQVAVVLVNARLTDELEAQRAELEQARAELERLNRQQAAELAEAREALAHARRDLKHEYPDIIGRSPAMGRVLELVDRVVDHDVPVLIGGESGTGKELLARTLHDHGPRAERSFVAINCGALPETLLESELFGHVKGAFTGADRNHDGLFRVAHGGTLLLDEVGEMSPAMQAKLLRVLQEGEIRPVGGNRELPVDVRILAATNRDLAALVEQGGFRQDLFYRLNVISLVLPPLRERLEDLPALADFFAGRTAERMGLRARRLSRAALRRLLDYRWPGNVRELENVIANALLMADGEAVGPGDLTLPRSTAPRSRPGRRLADLERDAVEAALKETGGNRTRAAALLGMSRVTLQRRLKKWREE